ncbi:MAG: respiratory chain complex I subunit 1 family protein [Fimbriimonadaceae bacterium]
MSLGLWYQGAHLIALALVPLSLASVIRRTKARMQGRPGPPFLQPGFELIRRLCKGETISTTSSWIFRANPVIGLTIALILALVIPWTGAQPLVSGTGAADFILVAYLLALARFFSILAALDTGSAFGGLGASRESTLGILIEPGVLVSLAAVAVSAGASDLSIALTTPIPASVALLSGAAFFVAALAELSRMPVDDPTTHLELTMIHEATILENSGRNLALIELTVAVKTAVFFGIGARLLLGCVVPARETGPAQILLTVGTILVCGFALGVLEGITVKLNWRRIPSFVAFSTALAAMAAFVAVLRGQG